MAGTSQLSAKVRKTPFLRACFHVPSSLSRDLDKDLKAANIPKIAPGGKLDFHTCRLAYINFVLERGASVKEAQTLARHATADLTMNVYGCVREERLSQVVEEVAENLVAERKRATCVPQVAVGAEQENTTPVFSKELRFKKMVELRGIEPVGVDGPPDAEPQQEPAKPQQNNALEPEGEKSSGQKCAETTQNNSTFLRPKCVPSVYQKSMPADLGKVIEAWDVLPQPIKVAIVAMVEAAGKE